VLTDQNTEYPAELNFGNASLNSIYFLPKVTIWSKQITGGGLPSDTNRPTTPIKWVANFSIPEKLKPTKLIIGKIRFNAVSPNMQAESDVQADLTKTQKV
jgi:hypothetical protein